MKKIIALILSMVTLFSVCVPIFAINYETEGFEDGSVSSERYNIGDASADSGASITEAPDALISYNSESLNALHLGNKSGVSSVCKNFPSGISDGEIAFDIRIDAIGTLGITVEIGECSVIEIKRADSLGEDAPFQMFYKSTDGNIIIMDEPANGLHVKGMRELRKFLKDYAHKSNVTIVLSTNLPFLIDEDNLDELRLVKCTEGKSEIQNDFSTVCLENPDALADVCKALTVDHHILSDPQKILVFVEGITDYNYLTCFKKLLGNKYDDLSFIPVGGLGGGSSTERKEYQVRLLKELQRISKKRDAFLLADGDKAGKGIKDLVSDNKDFKVLLLTDVDQSYKEIENLFSDEDKTKFEINDDSAENRYIKSSTLSANMKKYSVIDDFSQETVDNFRKLFDTLLSESE